VLTNLLALSYAEARRQWWKGSGESARQQRMGEHLDRRGAEACGTFLDQRALSRICVNECTLEEIRVKQIVRLIRERPTRLRSE
jgi:hypothetical protein